MATIEVTQELVGDLSRLFHATCANETTHELRVPLIDLMFDIRMALVTEKNNLTQELPGPEGYPNEFVPSDFFS